MHFTKIIFSLLLSFGFPQLEYSQQDMNTTSPTYGNNVWSPSYTDHITMHYFSSQG